jgi:serine/threonine-protein kinase
LNRDAALKVLPEVFARDAERMARFRREAQVLASLNHPNIATVHGLEESSGNCALVMELVEGPTLAERIGRRTLTPNPSPGGRGESKTEDMPSPLGRTEGGTEPVWARNGRELFYRIGDKMMVTAVETKPVQPNPSSCSKGITRRASFFSNQTTTSARTGSGS